MQFSENIGEISVCDDCMFVHANGEYPGDPDDRVANAPEAWALWGFGYFPAMGGEHTEDCDRSDDTDCDCDNLGFSWSSCEGCGSNLGGDRYRFTMFRQTRESAHESARASLQRAASARELNVPVVAREAMAEVAMWRAYLSDIAASERRFNRWLASA